MKRLCWLVCMIIGVCSMLCCGLFCLMTICCIGAVIQKQFSFDLNTGGLIVLCLIIALVCRGVWIGTSCLVGKLENAIEKEKAAKRKKEYHYKGYASSFGSGGYGYSSSSGGYDHTVHDEIDATMRAQEITRIYGDDWRGYDPEASGPDPDSYSSGPSPDTYSDWDAW